MRRALVVDDDRTMVETIGDILGLRGWDVTGAHSGEEAIAVSRQDPFDCVIMDVKMGGVDGINALQEIRRSRPGLPVILMTAYTAYELIAEAEREGVLRRLSAFRDVQPVGATLVGSVRNGRPIAFVTGRSGPLDAMISYLERHRCPIRIAESADAVTAALRAPPAVVLWQQQLPVVDEDGVVIIADTSPGALLAAWGVEEEDSREDPPQFASRLRCGYLRKPFDIDSLLATLDHLTA